ncbi:putative calcium-binding protein CML10 [Morella rubra]|uniref:Putative calcium-binding protein CML10 n=1 Tax=Morella rubra TaxID=262757 RepID=A0A6A1UYX3_9ROSI|nr:putative calcium-binding protein CML10 [Morella rubra]KAB1205582.1 putative calcium-binding protein CML10 [Morella rubra]
MPAQLHTIRQKNVAYGCSKGMDQYKTVPLPYTGEQLRGMFKRFDTNGDGQLSRQELRNAFRSLGSAAPGWRAFRALGHADRNGDGQISEAELDNLVGYALKHGYTVN